MIKVMKKVLVAIALTPIFGASAGLIGDILEPILAPILGISAANCSAMIDPIYFGNYNPFNNGDVLSSSKVSVLCDKTTNYVLRVRTGSSGNSVYREMKNSIYPEKNTPLKYSLFLDSGRSLIWGDGTGVSRIYQGKASKNTSDNVNIYGKIYKLQNVYKGPYRENVVIELEY